MSEHEHRCVERRLASASGTRVQLEVHNAVAEPARASWLDGRDGVIIGGSGAYSVHHPASAAWVNPLRDLLELTLRRRVPGFGICFGHQLLGQHLGSEVITDDDRAELGTVPLRLTPQGERDPVFGRLEPDFHAHTGHSDHVTSVPVGSELLAVGDRLENQALKVRDAPFYSTQFHPDLTGAEAIDRYIAYRRHKDGGVTDELMVAVSQFRPGADATASLLSAFVEEAVLPRLSKSLKSRRKTA